MQSRAGRVLASVPAIWPRSHREFVMPLERSQLVRWLRRNWFLVVVLSFAMSLALVQAWVQWTFHPPLIVDGAVAIVALATLFVFVLVVLRLRRPLAEMRYRWLTRRVDRAMNEARRRANRPAA